MILNLWNKLHSVYKANGCLVTIIVFTPLHDILAATSYECPLNLEIGKLRCLISETITLSIPSQVVASVILHIPMYISLISSYDVK